MEKKDSERRQQADAAEEAARREAARSAIALRDLALDKVQFNKERGSSWTLTGNITNNSKYSLGSLGFKVRVEDCPPTPQPGEWGVVPGELKECITVGEANAWADVYVPPGQMRAFSSRPIYFEGMTRSRRWHYEITEMRAAL
jgi:hypothetical protein